LLFLGSPPFDGERERGTRSRPRSAIADKRPQGLGAKKLPLAGAVCGGQKALSQNGYGNQVSILISVHNNAISRAGVGDQLRSPSGAVWNGVWSLRKARIMHHRGASSHFAAQAGLGSRRAGHSGPGGALYRSVSGGEVVTFPV
jgi:hypothetical protein